MTKRIRRICWYGFLRQVRPTLNTRIGSTVLGSFSPLALIVLWGLAVVTPAPAANLYWTNTTSSGIYSNSGNWNPVFVPGEQAIDATIFTNDTDYTVNFTANATLATNYFNGHAGVVTLDITGYTWNLTNGASGSSGNGAFSVGRDAATTATVYLAGGTVAATNVNNNAYVIVGGQGKGTFFVTNGTVVANRTQLGSTATGVGKLVLSGAGAYYTNTSTFQIGAAAGSTGNSLVISNGASLTSIGAFTMGNSSDGNSLLITNGTLTAVQATIGNNSANNSATFLAGGYWNSSSTFIIGTGGGTSNSVTVNGGVMTNNGANVGSTTSSAGGFNSLTITNGGLFYTSGGLVIANYSGAGGGLSNSVRVLDNATLNMGNQALRIGYANYATGNYVRVDGGVLTNVGQSLQFGNGLYIGGSAGTALPGINAYGNGLLIVNTGKVFMGLANGAAWIGFQAGANGNYLTVSNGGQFLGAANVYVGGTNAYNNAYNVGGGVTRSTVSNNAINVGYISGGNTMTVTNADLTSSTTIIGNGGSNNTATVLAGGIWELRASSLTIGSGAATGNVLQVNAGGVVTNVDTLAVGSGGGAWSNRFIMSGAATVSVVNLVATNIDGNANLVTFNGGLLSAKNIFITNSAPFTVGDGATAATLNELGGFVDVSNGIVVANNGTITGGGTNRSPVQVINNGNIFASSTTAHLMFTNTSGADVTFGNAGTIGAANGATLSFLGQTGPQLLTNFGTINLQGGTLLTGNLTNLTTGVITNFGTIAGGVYNQGVIKAAGGNLLLAAGLLGSTNAGTLSALTGGNLVLGTASNLVVNNVGTVNLAGGTLISGNVTNLAGGTIRGFGTLSNVVNLAGGTVSNGAGTLVIRSFSAQNGTVFIGNNGTLQIGTAATAGAFSNAGVVSFLGGTLVASSITNAGGATFQLATGARGTIASNATTTVTPRFVNAGVIALASGQTLTFAGVTLTNASSGYLVGSGGSLVFSNGSFFNLSTATTSWQFGGGSTLLFTNNINSLGAFYLTANSLDSGTSSVSTQNNFFVSQLTLAGGSLTLTNGATGGSTALYVKDLNISNNATLYLNGMTIYFAGNTNFATGVTINYAGGQILKLQTSQVLAWDTNGGTNDWNITGNWDGTVVPGVQDVALLTNATVATGTFFTNAAATVTTLVISNNSTAKQSLILSNGNLSVSGSTLVGKNGILQLGAGSATATMTNLTLTVATGGAVVLTNSSLAAANQLVAGILSSAPGSTITMTGSSGATNLLVVTTGIFANNGYLASAGATNIIRAGSASNAGTNALLGGVLIYQDSSGNPLPLVNTGRIVLNGGELNSVVTNASSGLITGNAGTLSGALINLVGGVISNHNGSWVLSGAFDNLGTFVVNNNGLVTNTGLVAIISNGTAQVNNGRWVVQNTLQVAGRLSGASLTVTNGGQLTAGGAVTIGTGSNSSNNLAQVVGGGVTPSVWNLEGNALTIGDAASKTNLLRVDGLGVAGRAVVSNVGALVLGGSATATGNRLIVTNGGVLLRTTGVSGDTVIGGAGSSSNSVLVVGGNSGATSVWNNGGGKGLVIGNNGAFDNSLLVDGRGVAGGAVVTNLTAATALEVGGGSGAFRNQLILTNGGRLFTAGSSGPIIGNTGNSNTATVVGGAANSQWIVGSGALTVGNGAATGNVLTVQSGGTVLATSVVVSASTTSRSNQITVAGGNLLVTNSGGTATLDVGRSGLGVLTLDSGILFANTLLVTNNSATTTNSFFNFNGGTLITSNQTVASRLLISTNSVFDVRGTWNMLGGTNFIAPTVGTAGSVSIGNNSGNAAVLVGSNVVWDIGQLGLTIGGGAATGNTVTVNGGMITNISGTLTIGAGVNSFGNRLTLSNGASLVSTFQAFLGGNGSSNSFNVGGAGAASSAAFGLMRINGTNNTLTITNAAMLTAGALGIGNTSVSTSNSLRVLAGGTWQVTSTLTIGNTGSSNNWLLVNGGVVTSATIYVGSSTAGSGGFNSLILTNGGQLDSTALILAQGAQSGISNSVSVLANSFWNMNNQSLRVGDADYATGNWVRVDGGTLTNVAQIGGNSLTIGGSMNGSGTNAAGNYLLVVNGGKLVANLLQAPQVRIGDQFGATGNYLSISNNGQFLGGNIIVGNTNAYGNAYNVGGKGAVSFASNTTINVGIVSRDNRLTVTNASLLSGASTIGNNASNNTATVLAGGTWNLLGNTLTVGSGAATGNVLRIGRSGLVSNVATVNIATGTGARFNRLSVEGGKLHATDLHFGTDVGNQLLVGNRGTAEVVNAWNNTATVTMQGGSVHGGRVTNSLWMSGYGTLAPAVINQSGATIVANNSTTALTFDSTLVNQVGGVISAFHGRVSVAGVFTNAGTLSFLNSAGTFHSAVVNQGAWISDPTTLTFHGNLLVETNGFLAAGAGDVYRFRSNFVNISTRPNDFNTFGAQFVFDGGTNLLTQSSYTQQFYVAGLNLGGWQSTLQTSNEEFFTTMDGTFSTNSFQFYGQDAIAGYSNNFALGELTLGNTGTNTTLVLLDSFGTIGPDDGQVAGLYLNKLTLNSGSLLIISNNVQVYFRSTNGVTGVSFGTLNAGDNILLLDGASFHQLILVPEPSVLVLWCGGILTIWAARRRRVRRNQ
ncbi:MAG: hypothetical protein PCFJNLEI_02581 [Verrucomicrobiae bacterium]|nr:hypothetical protein [Verrucomicrobiae bacterium]